LFFPNVLLRFVSWKSSYTRTELLEYQLLTTHSPPGTMDLFSETSGCLGVVPERRKQRRRHRGRHSRVLVRLRHRSKRPPWPSILLDNVQSLMNTPDKVRVKISLQILQYSVFFCRLCSPPISKWADRNRDLSGKDNDGGLYFMTHNIWFDGGNLQEITNLCCPNCCPNCTALVQPIRTHASRLFWSRRLEYVHRWICWLRHGIHKQINRWCDNDKCRNQPVDWWQDCRETKRERCCL
jgi:hypothetical protein